MQVKPTSRHINQEEVIDICLEMGQAKVLILRDEAIRALLYSDEGQVVYLISF